MPKVVQVRNIEKINCAQLESFKSCIVYIAPRVDSRGEVYYAIRFTTQKDSECFTRLITKSGDEGSPYSTEEARDGYFLSYGSSYIHRLMLADERRNRAYYKAILGSPRLFRDKDVMDIGAGSGILSLFAARAGASRVIAVEAVGSMADVCREIAQVNGFEGVIEVVNKRVEEMEDEAVDIIVSEWMGYCLFFEGMLLSILYARDKFLRGGGLLFPNKASLILAGFSDPSILKKKEEAYHLASFQEYDLSCLLQEHESNSSVSIQNCSHFGTRTHNVCSMDLNDWIADGSGLYFESDWSLLPPKGSSMTVIDGFLLYFNVSFTHNEESSVILSTRPSPNNQSNHWKQTLLIFDKPIEFTEALRGSISLKQMNSRGLEFSVAFENYDKKTFYLS